MNVSEVLPHHARASRKQIETLLTYGELKQRNEVLEKQRYKQRVLHSGQEVQIFRKDGKSMTAKDESTLFGSEEDSMKIDCTYELASNKKFYCVWNLHDEAWGRQMSAPLKQVSFSTKCFEVKIVTVMVLDCDWKRQVWENAGLHPPSRKSLLAAAMLSEKKKPKRSGFRDGSDRSGNGGKNSGKGSGKCKDQSKGKGKGNDHWGGKGHWNKGSGVWDEGAGAGDGFGQGSYQTPQRRPSGNSMHSLNSQNLYTHTWTPSYQGGYNHSQGAAGDGYCGYDSNLHDFGRGRSRDRGDSHSQSSRSEGGRSRSRDGDYRGDGSSGDGCWYGS